jgi:DNA-directed RNA polymerase subunit D
VYSGDLESIGDPRFAVVDKSIPIVKLQEGQAVLIYATAILGTGAQHAKWQVTSGVGYKNYPKIEINDKLCDHRGECVKACPKGVLILKNKRVVIENIEDCSLCKACEEVCHPPRTKGRKKRTAIRVTPEDTKFIFQFETDGSLTASQTLRYALSLLSDKFSTFSEQIGELSRSK